jgi:N6-adenosine-specific RNA methylase IME4
VNDAAEANQAYGALTEGLYLASFTFERAMGRVLSLMKGDEWRRVGAGFDDVNDFIRSLQFDRFKVLAEQRKEFTARVKELQPEVSNRAIANALGVHHDTIDRAVRGGNPPPGPQYAGETWMEFGGNPPHSAADGRHDAARINARDTREERRQEKLLSIAQAARLSGLHSVIYADPPWEDDFGFNDRAVDDRYPTMKLEAIKALPVTEISTPDAVLYLWALPHMAPTAIEVMSAWGFDYRTEIIWDKGEIGLGEWARNRHENLLIGRRGAFPPPPTASRSSSVISAPRGEHSAKPDVFAEMVERWYPESAKMELFRRGAPRPGWAAWGNEAKAAAE